METGHRVSLQWIPEDDLLLRNAVEAGASLEALAKGAVEFSRRYTLQELKERWYSLLYDDDISSQAAYHMFELEISGVSSSSKYRPESSSGRNKDTRKIRRTESIRKKYYSLRKRLRTEFHSDIGMDLLEPNNSVMREHIANFQEPVIPGGDLFEEDMLDMLRHVFPGNVEGTPVEYGATNVAEHAVNPELFQEDYENRIMGDAVFNENLATSSEVRADNPGVSLEASPSIRNDPVDGSRGNTLDGFVARQQFHLPKYDCLDTVFSCNEAQLQQWTEMRDVKSPALLASMGLPRSPEASEHMVNANVEKETNEAVNLGEIVDSDALFNLPTEVESLLVDFDEKPAAEYKSCTLDIDAIHRDSINSSLELTTDVCEVKTFPEATLEVTNSPDLTQNCSCSAVCGDVANIQSTLDLPSKPDFTVFNDGKVCCLLNTEDLEIPCNDDIFLLIHPTSSPFPSETQLGSTVPQFTTTCSPIRREHEQAFNSLAKETMRSSVLLHPTPKLVENCVKKEALGLDIKVANNLPSVPHLAAVPAKELHLEYESPVSDDENSQIDCDVPYFSDVESLILEMDLDPYDENSHTNRKDPSYQYDETKRTIIRLEQGARSCLQRAMTSKGAFAILYGRYLRHYIRKTEVLLGRSTDDITVDIDLAMEGRANKISRRQAIIKMEPNGSFFMKNLGRSSIRLNGTTVLSGQVVNLSSGCLIEIKGMSFVFEINHGYVKKHLGNSCLSRRKEEPC